MDTLRGDTKNERLEIVPPGRRKQGRPKQRWMDCVNRDMIAIGMTKDEVQTELAGGELCLSQRPNNRVAAAIRRTTTRGTINVSWNRSAVRVGVQVEPDNIGRHK